MFCTNCGREIINTAKFCNYCGRPTQNTAPPPPYPSHNMGYIPESGQSDTIFRPDPMEYSSSGASEMFFKNDLDAAESADELNSEFSEPNTAEETYITTSKPFITEKTSETETISQQAAANSMFSAGAEPYPTPGTIPKSGGSYSGMYSGAMPDTTVNITAEPPASVSDRKHKYTLGHILLCLASTAIMAITAGIFAGLYFSVVYHK